jgi:hypothetical protein
MICHYFLFVKAVELYKNQNAEALSRGENYDGLVKVELPGDGWLPIEQLGEACQVAKRSVGKNRQDFCASSCIWIHTRRGSC